MSDLSQSLAPVLVQFEYLEYSSYLACHAVAIQHAIRDKIDWLVHLSMLELLHPSGTGNYSIQTVLQRIKPDIDVVILPNHEGLLERNDIQNPFTEVR